MSFNPPLLHILCFQLPELSQFTVGLMHIQLLHTSASLAINENWDPDVRDDMEMMLNRIIPEDVPFRHSCEGPDDMVRRAYRDRLKVGAPGLVNFISAVAYHFCPGCLQHSHNLVRRL